MLRCALAAWGSMPLTRPKPFSESKPVSHTEMGHHKPLGVPESPGMAPSADSHTLRMLMLQDVQLSHQEATRHVHRSLRGIPVEVKAGLATRPITAGAHHDAQHESRQARRALQFKPHLAVAKGQVRNLHQMSTSKTARKLPPRVLNLVLQNMVYTHTI